MVTGPIFSVMQAALPVDKISGSRLHGEEFFVQTPNAPGTQHDSPRDAPGG